METELVPGRDGKRNKNQIQSSVQYYQNGLHNRLFSVGKKETYRGQYQDCVIRTDFLYNRQTR